MTGCLITEACYNNNRGLIKRHARRNGQDNRMSSRIALSSYAMANMVEL